ncbi:ras-related protein Rab-43 [Hydra vulgaris]|uniref:Ras-related protein Rab-43 n=1 Tax=Hydra vulgaris TaxID=6087 RepID=A0ABM4DJ85_HYDVU
MQTVLSSNDAVDTDFDYLFKIVLIGDAGVGKTAIVHRFKYNTFVDRHASTIGVDFTIKTIQVDDKKIKLQIWDTAGQERFRTITQSYYRSANGVILVYDVSKMDSFKNINYWLQDVKRYAGNSIYQMLVGNKSDLESHREVPKQEADSFATQLGILEFMELSAKDNSNIDEAFWRIAKNLKDRYENESNTLRGAQTKQDVFINSKSVGNWCC